MAAALAVIGVIAGATGAVAGALGVIGIGGAIMGTIATVASVVATVASLGASLLSKPPPARGQVSNITVDSDAPAPYWMGEGLAGGVLRHDVGYGATLNKVPNPYRWMVMVYSVAGPISSITPYIEQAAIGSYYSGFVYTDTQLGTVPESTALAPNFAGPPGWDSTSKLSGCAAIGWNHKFDKDGKVFSAGLPRLAAYGQGVKVYDPRLDSTYPGGSGSHRANDETTWAYSANPALHAGTYALGRHVSGDRVMGIGMSFDTIDWAAVVSWANLCEDNAWTLFGVAWEGGAGADLMAQRVSNLRDICAAGGGEFVFSGGKLSFSWSAPRVALDTFTDDDLASDEGDVLAMATYRERVNTVVPKIISADHEWELVDLEPVVASTYVTEDGQERKAAWPFNFVKDADQGAQLGAYRLVDSRELLANGLTFGERCMAYRPGEVVHLTIARLGLDHDALILTREVDPAALTVTFTFRTEDPDKHAFALGQTGTPPPTPALGQTAEERDAIAAAVIVPASAAHLIVSKTVAYPLTSDDDQIDIAAFDGVLDDGRSVSFPSGSVTGLTSDTLYTVFRNIDAGTYSAVASPATTEMADSDMAVIGAQATSTGGVWTPPGDPPDGYYNDNDYR